MAETEIRFDFRREIPEKMPEKCQNFVSFHSATYVTEFSKIFRKHVFLLVLRFIERKHTVIAEKSTIFEKSVFFTAVTINYLSLGC